MYRTPKTLIVSAAACLIVFLGIIPLKAANGAGFQGFFNYRQVEIADNQVSLTLDIKILNHTGADVRDATISVRSLSHPSANYGSFPALSIGPRQAADLTQVLNVPQHEFELWQRGARPRFVITYTDSSGKSVQQLVEMLRRPLKGGN